MGVILYTMLCARLPFDDSNLRSLLQQVHKKVTFPCKVTISEEAKNIIYRMLSWNVHERVVVEQLGEDAWVKVEKEPSKAEPMEEEEEEEKTEVETGPDS